MGGFGAEKLGRKTLGYFRVCAGFFGVCGELWLISGFNACFTGI
jgi:S-formylglutathione hydrolase FrmB